MTGTFTRNAIAGVEGIWMRASTQVVTLRFRRSAAAGDGPAEAAAAGGGGGTPVEGSVDWPEEQASAEFRGRIFAETSSSPSAKSVAGAAAVPAVLTLEGKVGEVFQGAPERVGWAAGAEIRGTFCKDGTDGTIKGKWSARAAATALEPLRPGGMRLNVGLLPDRLLAAEGNNPGGGGGGGGGRSSATGSGSSTDPVMGSSCRWVVWGAEPSGEVVELAGAAELLFRCSGCSSVAQFGL